MSLQLMNQESKYAPPRFVEPPPYGYVHLGAVVEPPKGRAPFPANSSRKKELLSRVASLAVKLGQHPEVVRATVYRARLIPPIGGPGAAASFDVAVLVETTSPATLDIVCASQAYGEIVTMSSSAARQPSQSSAAYAAGKAGVIALTRHLANEVGHQGVRINCLSPAAVVNDKMRAWVSEKDRAAMGATYPLGRLGQPEDVAAAALFLASDASSWITGVTLDIAGGKVMV